MSNARNGSAGSNGVQALTWCPFIHGPLAQDNGEGEVEKAYHWLLAQGIRPENIASIGYSIGGNLAVSLAVTLRDKGAPLPATILSASPWCDMEMKNQTLESKAETDALLTRRLLEVFR
ncbi:MAG TPA: alpha/beta hydrolase fold domain-containing protein, partial [Gemmataceae bacterium]|nr:alpha/beta hydrolase fold domain-containing protein [Gemmataceae bacterium]